MRETARVKLLTTRDGTYTVFVFQNLDNNQYIMCTRLPNWQTPEIRNGDIGFLEYDKVKAGESYYNPITETTTCYNYSNTYFINFVQKTDISQNNEIIL